MEEELCEEEKSGEEIILKKNLFADEFGKSGLLCVCLLLIFVFDSGNYSEPI